MRVHLFPRAEVGYVCVDLHWGTSRDTSMGYLATGGSKAVGKEGGSFDFAITVPPAQGLRFVTAIVFLSRTGSWQDHTLTASTAVIPVSSNKVGEVELPLEPLRLQPRGDDPKMHAHPAVIPRLLTALLFLAATVAAWGSGQSPAGSNGRPGSEKRWWQALAVLLALACLGEFFGMEGWLGAQGRAMARAEDFYYPRAAFQKVMISVAVAATAGFLLFVWRARRSHRLLLVGFGLYLGISLVNLVSLHVVDRIADLSWHGITLVQALKTGCAAMTLRGVVIATRKHSGDSL